MKNYIFYAVLILFSVLSLSKSNGQSSNLEFGKPDSYIPFCQSIHADSLDEINMEYVKIDIDKIRNFINPIASCQTLAQIKKALPFLFKRKGNTSTSDPINQGYGLQTFKHTIYGGYSTFYVSALYFDEYIIKLRLMISSRREILDQFLLPEIQLGFECKNGMVIYDLINTENLKKYHKTYGPLFLESLEPNNRRREALNYFSGVLINSEFAKPYYISYRLGASTFDHLRYFVVNRDYNALETLLYAPSPTSRLFAARTLEYMCSTYNHKIDVKLKNRVDTILCQSEPIRSGIISCHIGRFEYDIYDVISNFDYYMLSE